MTGLSIIACQTNPVMGDVAGNAQRIAEMAKAQGKNALCVFPELCLVGYPPEDLVYSSALRAAVEAEIQKLAKTLKNSAAVIIGAPFWDEAAPDMRKRGHDRNLPYNAALLIADGEVKGRVFKSDLPNYDVFDDKRVFNAGPLPLPIDFKDRKLGVMVCEDVWTAPVSDHLKAHGADILIAINASPYERRKHARRVAVCRARVAETGLPLLYVNQIGGQDDLLFDGQSFALDAQGQITMHAPAFKEGAVAPNARIVKPSDEREVYDGLVLATRDYVRKNGSKGAIIGLSGGIDSALVAAIAVDALGGENVRLVTLPSRFNSNESIDDAHQVADALGIGMEMQPIEQIVRVFEDQLKITSGIAHENIQSRIRGMTLMALSNAAPGWLVLSTTNKSELAVGYGTIYGDMAGAYAPLRDLYKRDVFALSRLRQIPERIITKPPSAELRDDQRDEDSLPPYDVLDAVLYQLIEEDRAPSTVSGADTDTVLRIARMLRQSEFKRRQGPPGPKIGPKAFGRDRRYPITNALQET